MTDVYSARLKARWIYPVLPGMNTMIDPRTSLVKMAMGVARTTLIITASIWGWIARPIKRVGTANTSLFHHDGRVLATNEIGPPMRVFLPSLKTVGWFTGSQAEGELDQEDPSLPYFGAPGLEGFYKEMTTAHPRVDRKTGELLLFHSTFIPPYINYSIVPKGAPEQSTPILNQPVPGLNAGKLMHDFGVSHKHTVLIDSPVTLNPLRVRYGKPAVEYDPEGPTRLGVFPRHRPHEATWYTTDACIVMHTVNTWDEKEANGLRVHSLLCRLNSLSSLYWMGGLECPKWASHSEPECRLYYYQFPPAGSSQNITHQWALSAIPFEFPHVPRHLEMSATKYVYGCSMREGNFATSYNSCVKIDCLVKVNVESLLRKGLENPPPQ
ncbi:hypothetical protein AbraCBS73388_007823, partial [Aspergillus brasiliensis]